jgi:hypothetical protein
VKRVLLDENVAHALRKHLSNHETVTAAYAGFVGLKNGELLKAAVEAGFDVLVTGDKTLQYEQNLSGDKIAVVSLSANGWRIIAPYVAKIAVAVESHLPSWRICWAIRYVSLNPVRARLVGARGGIVEWTSQPSGIIDPAAKLSSRGDDLRGASFWALSPPPKPGAPHLARFSRDVGYRRPSRASRSTWTLLIWCFAIRLRSAWYGLAKRFITGSSLRILSSISARRSASCDRQRTRHREKSGDRTGRYLRRT